MAHNWKDRMSSEKGKDQTYNDITILTWSPTVLSKRGKVMHVVVDKKDSVINLNMRGKT